MLGRCRPGARGGTRPSLRIMSSGVALHRGVLGLGWGCARGVLVAVDDAKLADGWETDVVVVCGGRVRVRGVVHLVVLS